MAIEGFKFYYKMAHFSHQENIYLENHEEKPQQKKEFSLRPLEKMSQLLEQIKTKTYECKDYQPEHFEELACGKKIQLVTSVKVPEELKRPKLNFWALLGEVLSLLRPFLSIIAIRLWGMDNFKSYVISLGIDLFILIILQRNMIVSKKEELDELANRKK